MDWMIIVQQLGFPIAATFALAYCVYAIATFFAEKIYMPMQNKHFKLVDKLESSLDTINNCQLDLVSNMGRLVQSITTLEHKVTKIDGNQLKITELIDKLSQNLDELEQRLKSVEVK